MEDSYIEEENSITNIFNDKIQSIKYKLKDQEKEQEIELKHSLIDIVRQKMRCANCKILMKDPFLTECEHYFCNDCKYKITECPIDKEKISNFILRKPLKKLIENLNLNCVNNSNDCLWKG